MKTYIFALPEQEAEFLDANVQLLCYAYPDLTKQDALIAILRIGSEDIARRIERLEASHAS